MAKRIKITRSSPAEEKEYWVDSENVRVIIEAKTWDKADKIFKNFIRTVRRKNLNIK